MAKASDDAIRQLRSPYTLEDVDTALRTLAFLAGNVRRATTALNEAGIEISKRTLERWSQRQYPEAYAEAQGEVHRVAWQNSLSRAMQVLENRVLGRAERSWSSGSTDCKRICKRTRWNRPSLAGMGMQPRTPDCAFPGTGPHQAERSATELGGHDVRGRQVRARLLVPANRRFAGTVGSLAVTGSSGRSPQPRS